MSDTTTTPGRRVFKYGDHSFEDPGAAYTPEQVRAHLAAFFPELGQATVDEQQRPDGTVEISFRKQITTKGAAVGDETAVGDEAAAIGCLVETLARLPPYKDSLQAAIGALGIEAFTYERLLAHYESLGPAADAGDAETEKRHGVIQQCWQIPPIPLPAVPLGY